ncbi:DNA-3-methyladenine glycosylase I [Verrucomicrobium sp. GAS474]|uniref:DNA-3-methyladenine glycosylase I n=1 Tax=Verrucomicrobium sp. GAS474 TaxID=1882831 RepID=UPI00087CDE25|nr:DNA-3-methyladenine glycosylase I [Verrucomicrobium sp. GAS474]SDT91629.1 DNA-3-methyladenine glycosylase I [Verrucomicrobium sp. GAS474]
MIPSPAKPRCAWVPLDKPHYVAYHDTEWGVPVHDDRLLFEMLILEGAQAGLSWETILKRREGYRKAFRQFDPKKVAKMTDAELEALMDDPGIIRLRLKIVSARKNAVAFLAIQKEFGSFDAYLWNCVGGKPRVTARQAGSTPTVTSPESDALSKDLKKRGMTFVGSTILYAYLQAVGVVNDHSVDCFCFSRRGK